MTLRMLYIIFQVIGVIILVGEFLYVITKRPSNVQRDLIIILLSLIVSFITYIVELQAENLQTALVGCVLGYLGKPFALLTTFYLLIDYAHIKVNRKITIAVSLYFLFLTVIVFTNQFHHLYYPEVSYAPERIGSPLLITHGVFWYIYMASSFALYFAYIYIIIYEYKYSKTKQEKEMAALLFLMMFFSILGLVLFIAGLTNGYDSTLFGTMLGSICLLILLSKYKIFDSLTYAKDKSFNDSDDGLIVLDSKSNIAYYNNKSMLFVPNIDTSWSHKKEIVIIEILDSFEENKPLFVGDKVYSLSIKTFMSPNNSIFYGKSYTFKDVTQDYYYQERLQQDIDKATSELVKIQRSILISFANIIEARDGCTGTHVKNVSYTAEMIAKELAKNPKYKDILTSEYITTIVESMPLHDVGKIKIPDNILGKPGKLTSEEYDIMKTHTTLGALIIDETIKDIERSNKFYIIREIALYHHEWWNGKGYPEGLKGDEIPLHARIAAISDVYDALRMQRPYKAAFSKEKSIEIIKEESGTHFDPDIVDAFLKISDELV